MFDVFLAWLFSLVVITATERIGATNNVGFTAPSELSLQEKLSVRPRNTKLPFDNVTLQALLGVPILLKFGEILVQNVDFGQSQCCHTRRGLGVVPKLLSYHHLDLTHGDADGLSDARFSVEVHDETARPANERTEQ